MTTTTERTRALLQIPEGLAMMIDAKTRRERADIARQLLRHYPTHSEIVTFADRSHDLLRGDYAREWE